jgi:hypothetical protein
MHWRQIGKHWSQAIQNAMRYWLDIGGGDMSNSRWQLERIVDCVCDRHGVARSTAELEIYKGLMRLTAENASPAATMRREKR